MADSEQTNLHDDGVTMETNQDGSIREQEAVFERDETEQEERVEEIEEKGAGQEIEKGTGEEVKKETTDESEELKLQVTQQSDQHEEENEGNEEEQRGKDEVELESKKENEETGEEKKEKEENGKEEKDEISLESKKEDEQSEVQEEKKGKEDQSLETVQESKQNEEKKENEEKEKDELNFEIEAGKEGEKEENEEARGEQKKENVENIEAEGKKENGEETKQENEDIDNIEEVNQESVKDGEEEQEDVDQGQEEEEYEEEEYLEDENANTKSPSLTKLEDMDAIIAELSGESDEEEEEEEEVQEEEEEEEEDDEETLAAKEDLAKKRTSIIEHLTAVRRESLLRRRESSEEVEEGEEGDEGIEEVEEFPEMTGEEKQAMHNAARDGDIELLDDLLDLPAADINMELYGENLLMTACRHHQKAMALFLIDNGVNYNYQMSRLVESEKANVRWDVYRINCRNFAYQFDMMDIVELIDYRNGELWPFIHLPPRVPRMKRPLEEKLRERGEWIEEEEEEEEEDEVDGEVKQKENHDGEGDAVMTTGPSEISDGRTSVLKESPSEVKSSPSPVSRPKSSQAVDAEADDASSGYDTMSESTESHQSTVRIVCNLEEPPIPEKRYQQNKAFLSRRRENEKYKTVMDDFVPKSRPSTSDCLTNIVWHADVKAKKVKESNTDTIRLQSPWKKDRPVDRASLHSRAKSAPESHWHNSKSQRQRQDFQLPEISIAWTGNRLSGVKRSESTLYQKPRTKNTPLKHPATVASVSASCLGEETRAFGRSRTTPHPGARSYSSLTSFGQSLSSCPSRSSMNTSLTTTRLLPDPGHKQKKQSPAGYKRTFTTKPPIVDLRTSGKKCHFRQATTMW